MAQYRSVRPWLLLREGDLTGPSTIMPQKRNPFGLNVVRQTASTVVADTAAFVLQARATLARVCSITKPDNRKRRSTMPR